MKKILSTTLIILSVLFSAENVEIELSQPPKLDYTYYSRVNVIFNNQAHIYDHRKKGDEQDKWVKILASILDDLEYQSLNTSKTGKQYYADRYIIRNLYKILSKQITECNNETAEQELFINTAYRSRLVDYDRFDQTNAVSVLVVDIDLQLTFSNYSSRISQKVFSLTLEHNSKDKIEELLTAVRIYLNRLENESWITVKREIYPKIGPDKIDFVNYVTEWNRLKELSQKYIDSKKRKHRKKALTNLAVYHEYKKEYPEAIKYYQELNKLKKNKVCRKRIELLEKLTKKKVKQKLNPLPP